MFLITMGIYADFSPICNISISLKKLFVLDFHIFKRPSFILGINSSIFSTGIDKFHTDTQFRKTKFSAKLIKMDNLDK